MPKNRPNPDNAAAIGLRSATKSAEKISRHREMLGLKGLLYFFEQGPPFMSMFDSYDGSSQTSLPNKSSGIEFNTDYVPQHNVAVVMLKLVVGLAMLAGAGYLLFRQPFFPDSLISRLAIIAGIELIYVGLAFLIAPRPNLDDVGFLGGIINNPLRYSDNYNRELRSWAVLLGPGRFISSSLLDFATILGVIKAEPKEETQFAYEMSRDVDSFAGSSLASVTCIDLDEPNEKISPAASATKVDAINRGDFD